MSSASGSGREGGAGNRRSRGALGSSSGGGEQGRRRSFGSSSRDEGGMAEDKGRRSSTSTLTSQGQQQQQHRSSGGQRAGGRASRDSLPSTTTTTLGQHEPGLLCVLDVAYAKDKTDRISIAVGADAAALAAVRRSGCASRLLACAIGDGKVGASSSSYRFCVWRSRLSLRSTGCRTGRR